MADDAASPTQTEQGDLVWVQVGCGPEHLREGWLNVDIRGFKGVDRVMNVAEPWPADWAGRVQYVYGEHFLEHLFIRDAIAFLREAGKALCPGGKLRLSTPALEWVMSNHFDPTIEDPTRMVEQTLRINRAFHGWGHQFLWSKAMLARTLEAAGFSRVTFYAYGESDDSNLRNLELHGGYSVFRGFPSVWIVEGTWEGGDRAVDEEHLARIHTEFTRHVEAGH